MASKLADLFVDIHSRDPQPAAFAAAALTGIIASPNAYPSMEAMVKVAWDYAELMMAEKCARTRWGNPPDPSNSEMGIGDTEATDGSNKRPS